MPIFLNPIVSPPGKGICPYLGMAEDPQTCLAYSSEWNLCQYARPAGRVSLEHQRTTCLQPEHTACPVYQSEQSRPLPKHLRKPRTAFGSRKAALLFFVLVLIAFGLWAAWQRSSQVALPVSDYPSSLQPTPLATLQSAVDTALSPVPTAPQALSQVTSSPLAPAPVQEATATPLKKCGYALEDKIELEQYVLTLHQVVYGENMDILALNYETSPQAIQTLNYFLPSPLWADIVIVIPIGRTEVSSLPIFEPVLVTEPILSLELLAQQLSVTVGDLDYSTLDTNCTAYAGWILVTRPARKTP